MFDRRAVLGLTLAFAAWGAALADAPAAQPFDQAAFDAALAEGRPVLVEVSASWCPVCRV
jgi:thiol:disulfide interchange protein